jgi:P4 family phage/plasmid primase-like protien
MAASFDGMMRGFKCTDNSSITHTRIGDRGLNIYGGKYSIPEEDLPRFQKLLRRKVFAERKHEFLTEKQLEGGGPVLVDLDFRYSADVLERQHDAGHMEDLVILYLESLAKIVDVATDVVFPIFVLEKPSVNTAEDTMTKDGIHIVIGVHLPHVAQLLLRDKVLEGIGDILEDLPLTNDYDAVLDVGISRGTTNWQHYGCRKPGHEAYAVVKRYIGRYDSGQPELEEEGLSNVQSLEVMDAISARKKDNVSFELREAAKKLCEKKSHSIKVRRKRPKTSIVLRGGARKLGRITTKEALEKAIEDILDEAKQADEYHIKETHMFTMLLSASRAEPYDDWLKVGLALRRTDYRLFLTWMLFSSQSDKFSFDDIPRHYDTWESLAPDRITDRSIMWWAREDDPAGYMDVKEQTIGYYIEKTIHEDTEYDIARVLYQMCQDSYKCINIKNKIWYEYTDGRWADIDSGTTLRRKLSTQLARVYNTKQAEIVDSIHTCEEEEERIKRQKLAQKMSVISMKLRKTAHKNNIMREACEHFFDARFMNKLDKNPYLLCFRNGVVDFEKKVFRAGRPEDYLSLCTNLDYIPFDDTNEEHLEIQREIVAFMEQLFPQPDLNRYMWQHLASVLRGDNKNQTFNIYTGCGRNGKSKLVEFLGMILGDYKGTVPITLITQKRGCIGSVSPEIAQLKGLRYAVMQEPSKGMTINEGVVKELTGGDPIQGRALFRDTVTFVPQFSLVVCTNHLFDIKSMDDGTWRRIRVCDYVSKFVDNPSSVVEEHEFKVDKEMEKKFERWKHVFAALLVKKAFETSGDVEDCEIVMASSNRYKQQQDFFTAFFDEKIVKHEQGYIRRTAVKEEFERWYNDLYRGAAPQGKDLYDFLTKRMGKPVGSRWKGYQLVYDCNDDLDVEPNGV